MNSKYEKQSPSDFAERVRTNQRKLGSDLKAQYDFLICGSGSSGSVVAGRLAADSNVSVLLLEAGGDDDVPEVMEAGRWPMNLGSERDWSFQSQPNGGYADVFVCSPIEGRDSASSAVCALCHAASRSRRSTAGSALPVSRMASASSDST